MRRPVARSAALSLVAAAVMSVAAAGGLSRGIQWQHDFDKAQAQARKQKRIMMVDFYADW